MSWNPALVADDGVKTTALERQGLAVSGYWPKRWFAQPAARAFKHRGRDVRTNDDAGGADDRAYRQRGLARSGGDIQNTGPWATSAAATTAGTKRRDHRPTQRSYAEGSTPPPTGNVKTRPELALIAASAVSPLLRVGRFADYVLAWGDVAIAKRQPGICC